MSRRLERASLRVLSDGERVELEHARRRWRTVALWLMGIGAAVGTSLRRPLRGDYGGEDLLWACLFAGLAGVLAIPYRIWQRRAEAESTALLARIARDTLFVYPRPGLEQRVPLMGVAELQRGEVFDDGVELKTLQPVALGGSHRVSLSVEQADEVIAFVNELLRTHAWHEL